MKQTVTLGHLQRYRCEPRVFIVKQSEVSQKEKNKYRILTHIHGFQENGSDESMCRAEMEMQMQRRNLQTQSGKKRETAESYSEESVWVGKQANPVHSFPTISITILFLPFCFIFHPDIFNTTFKGYTAFAVLLIL